MTSWGPIISLRHHSVAVAASSQRRSRSVETNTSSRCSNTNVKVHRSSTSRRTTLWSLTSTRVTPRLNGCVPLAQVLWYSSSGFGARRRRVNADADDRGSSSSGAAEIGVAGEVGTSSFEFRACWREVTSSLPSLCLGFLLLLCRDEVGVVYELDAPTAKSICEEVSSRRFRHSGRVARPTSRWNRARSFGRA